MRSTAERSSGSSRKYSMKPVGLPIVIRGQLVWAFLKKSAFECGTFDWLRISNSGFRTCSTSADAGDVAGVGFEGGHDGFFTAEAGILDALHGLEHAPVILGHHFDELGRVVLPIRKNCRGTRAARVGLVTLDHFPDLLDFVRVREFFESDHLQVATAWELTSLIEDIRNTAGHSRGEIAARRAKNNDSPTSHIFAPVVPDGFNNRGDTAVAHAKALASHTANVGFPTRRTVEGHVAHNNIILRHESG